jgi:hypothetical protein
MGNKQEEGVEGAAAERWSEGRWCGVEVDILAPGATASAWSQGTQGKGNSKPASTFRRGSGDFS